MTFGEHLEELRVSLFRALFGLVIGFVIGLFFGGNVVAFIQTPLTAALEGYYKDKTLGEAREELKKLKKEGKVLPANPDQIEQLVDEERLLPDDVFIQPDELIKALKLRYPELERFEIPEKAAPKKEDAQEGQDPEEPKITRDDLMRVFIWRPIEKDQRVRVKSLNAHEAFVIFIKASLLLGVLLASPWIFYQIWSFVAAGLYPHEKKYVHVFLPFSLGLFLAGAALAFFAVMKPVLTFLFSFNKWMGIDPEPRISEWLSFVLVLPVGFGIAFQLPLVMLFLERIGIFTVSTYLSKWRVAMLVIFVLSMFLTPADPTSMFLMAVPLVFLYAGGIMLCKFMPRSRSPYDDELEEEEKKMKKEEAGTAGQSKSDRSWFILKIVLAAALVVLLLAWRPLKEAAQQRAAVDRIEQLGGKVVYDYQLDESGGRIEGAQPPGWGVLRALLGADLFDTAVEVDLSGTEAGDAALDPLGGLTSLKKLDLRGTKVTDQAVQQLKGDLPGCKIVVGP